MLILGLDIGYSNLKFAYGNEENEKKEVILPSGAGPLTSLPITLAGETVNKGVEVKIGDELWVGGVAHQAFSNIFRELHADYPLTDTYDALLKTALASTGASNIDLLVTGLPVSQFKDKNKVKELKNLLEGVHRINDSKEVIVRKATIVPQPVGGYASLIQESSEEILDTITTGITVSIDPGFFSFDWVVLENGDIRSDLSGTSLQAVSVVLQEVSDSIFKKTGIRITVDYLEEAIRCNSNVLLVARKAIDIIPYIKEASLKVSEQAMKPILKNLRHEHKKISSIILCGGGASLYRKVTEELFADSTIFIVNDSLLANANGFYYIGHNSRKHKNEEQWDGRISNMRVSPTAFPELYEELKKTSHRDRIRRFCSLATVALLARKNTIRLKHED